MTVLLVDSDEEIDDPFGSKELHDVVIDNGQRGWDATSGDHHFMQITVSFVFPDAWMIHHTPDPSNSQSVSP